MNDSDRLLNTARRTLEDGCDSCGFSKVYCRCVAYIEGNGAACCDTCSHGGE